MSMESGRTSGFVRNTDLESLLSELEDLFKPSEAEALARATIPGRPVILVIGAPRSGTTLMLQWLAASGSLAYPTNLLSRFYHAPAMGARIHQLLANPKFAHRDELDGIAHPIHFDSDLGKTRGPLAPNEFWYFWRRFLPTTDIEPMGERVSDVDFAGLRKALAAMTGVFGKAMAMKGMMLQYDLETIGKQIPEAFFLHVQREPSANARSILDARRKFFGDPGRWYSAKPPNVELLLDREPEDQAAGQVLFTNARIRQGLDCLTAERYLRVPYETFCADPQETWSQLVDKLSSYGEALPEKHPFSQPFQATREARCDDEVKRAVDRMSRELHPH